MQTLPEERVDIAKKAATAFLKYGEPMEPAEEEKVGKLVYLLNMRLTMLLPTTIYSVGAAKDHGTVMLGAIDEAIQEWPLLDPVLQKLRYLVNEACKAVALDGLLLQKTAWRVQPDSFYNARTQQVVATSQPIYKVRGGNRNSTAARNTPKLLTEGDLMLVDDGPQTNFRHSWQEPGHVIPGDPAVPYTTIMARRLGEVIVEPKANENPFYHGIYREHETEPFEMRNIVIRKCTNAAIGSENPGSSRFSGSHPGFGPWRIRGLKIEGGWNAEKTPLVVDGKNIPLGDDGLPCVRLKWGMLFYAHGMGRTPEEWGLDLEDVNVSGVYEEHAFYPHNLHAKEWNWNAMRLKNFRIRWCGRTASQWHSRVNEGPYGVGKVLLEDGLIEDVCLQSGGGGYALTCAGRHSGEFRFRGVTVRLGCNPRLAGPRNRNICGAFTVYNGGGSDNIPTSDIVIENCDFEFGRYFPGEDSARRPLVKIGNDFSAEEPDKVDRKVVERITIKNTRLWGNPGTRETLNIASPTSFQLLTLDSKNVVHGPCVFAGTKYQTYDEMLGAINHPGVTIL